MHTGRKLLFLQTKILIQQPFLLLKELLISIHCMSTSNCKELYHAHNWYRIAAHWMGMEKGRWITGANNDWFTCGPKRAPWSHTMQLQDVIKNTCSTLQCKCRKNELPCSQACGDCRGAFCNNEMPAETDESELIDNGNIFKLYVFISCPFFKISF